jgi:hypothetical protein
MSTTTTASESIRVPRLGYRIRFRYGVAVVAASVAAAAGITAIAISDGGSGSFHRQPQVASRTGFGFEQPQTSAVGAAQAFHHQTGQTLRSTLTTNVSAAQAAQRFHHR